jgi:hypothetical protein
MKIADRDPLGPDFDLRLRAALDRIVPPTPYPSGARYKLMAISLNRRTLGLASLLAAACAAGVVLLSGFAATGSPNPVVWSQRAAATIRSVGHIPEATKAEPAQTSPSISSGSTAQPGANSQPADGSRSSEDQKTNGSEGSWKTPHPESTESPDPSHNHGASDNGQDNSHDWSHSHDQNPHGH